MLKMMQLRILVSRAASAVSRPSEHNQRATLASSLPLDTVKNAATAVKDAVTSPVETIGKAVDAVSDAADTSLESAEEKAQRLRRETPKSTLNDSTTRADDAYDYVKDNVHDVKDRVAENAAGARDYAKDSAANAKKHAKDANSDAKDCIQSSGANVESFES
jgi:hypothetical protein